MSLTDNYLRLITSEYADKPKYMAMVNNTLNMVSSIFEVAAYLDGNFDVDDAQGTQLDVAGQIVGAKRLLKFDPLQGQYPVLPDNAYRNLILATIAKNQWRGNIEELKELWRNLFGYPIIIQDNQDMTMTVGVIGFFDNLTLEMIKQGLIIPKVDGVGINYIFSRKAVFGYDIETESIKGYDRDAEWANNVLPPAFSYDEDNEEKRLFGYDKGEWV